MKRFNFIVLFSFLLCACSEPSTVITADFANMETDLNLLVKALKSDPIYKSKLDKFVSPCEINKGSLEALNRLGLDDISYVILSPPGCEENEAYEIEIIFNGDWHLTFDPCGVDVIQPGKHAEENEHFIEAWGLSQNWYLWVNRDFIG